MTQRSGTAQTTIFCEDCCTGNGCDCGHGPIDLSDLKPIGNPRIRSKTLARNERGGRVSIQIAAVHAHSCPFWREGRRHGPCNCGALEEWARFYPEAAA